MKNSTLQEIGARLREAKTVLLFPHVNMDGDALGSAVALCKGLRTLGKKCHILIEDEIAQYLRFLEKDYCISAGEKVKNPELCIAVDCGEVSRFQGRKDHFFKGQHTMCIDHHLSTDPVFDYNYIDTDASATAMLVYRILKELNVPLDREIGEAIWAGITTDTGNFQYSNTTKETHLIVAELYDLGIDHNDVSVKIYENIRPEKILMTNKVMDNLTFFAGGKGAITYATHSILKETGATPDETEGIVETLRCISGVEVAAFLREDGADNIKVSMRSKTQANVAEIAMRFNGGGHRKAAGCTIRATMEFALKMIINEIEITLREMENQKA
ncbi:MAG: bifunctional oligoribonuclease/PAP phosphatase NrnA [Anaerovoracaceae bacterium]|jgi:phosphoesterase RecJ-like protein